MGEAIKEIDLPALLEDWDWSAVFGEDGYGNTDKTTDACPPGADIDLTPPMRADVTEVIAAVNGENDEAEWVGVFFLKDGRYLLATGSCDYTGWDCQAGNHLEVAASLDDILKYGLTEEQKKRLYPNGPPMSGEQAAFLSAIRAEPENYLHRHVYADWLDEHDMPEEANRQRAFEDADRWLREFWAAEIGYYDEDSSRHVYYADMLEAAKSNPGSVIMTLPFDSPSVDVQRFWECIQIVTGVIVHDKTTFPFRCAC